MGKIDYSDVFAKLEAEKSKIPDKKLIIDIMKARGRLLGVKGSMDYIEQVLPHCYAAEKRVMEPVGNPPTLQNYDVVLVGCPGTVASPWLGKLRDFVHTGGYLVTTDWALDHLIERIVPGFISYGGTASGLYEVTLESPEHPFLEGIQDKDLQRWDLEKASHLIKVRKPKEVEVLIRAPELNPSPIMVTFQYGSGTIIHFLSHFHLQRSNDKTRYTSAFILTNIVEEAIKQKYAPKQTSRIRIISDGLGESGSGTKRVKLL